LCVCARAALLALSPSSLPRSLQLENERPLRERPLFPTLSHTHARTRAHACTHARAINRPSLGNDRDLIHLGVCVWGLLHHPGLSIDSAAGTPHSRCIALTSAPLSGGAALWRVLEFISIASWNPYFLYRCASARALPPPPLRSFPSYSRLPSLPLTLSLQLEMERLSLGNDPSRPARNRLEVRPAPHWPNSIRQSGEESCCTRGQYIYICIYIYIYIYIV
jgi:hypothetical protein